MARIVAGSPGPAVLDVGCGTGIAARQFQAAGCAVLGVEPDARMAEFARARRLAMGGHFTMANTALAVTAVRAATVRRTEGAS